METKHHTSIRKTVLEFILLIILTGVFAYLVHYIHRSLGYFPGKEDTLIFYAIIAFVSGYLGIRIVTDLLEGMVEPKIGITRSHGIKNVFQITAGVLLIVVVFGLLGFNLTGVLIGAGFLGIVLGLAAQQVLGNIFAGISLLGSRPFEIGERLTLVNSSYGLLGQSYAHENQLNGFTGVIDDVGIFFTKMTLDNGVPAVIPNSVVIGSMAVNHSRISMRTTRVRVDLDKKIDYDIFKSRLLELINKSEQIEPNKSRVEIVDVGTATYQIVVEVWSKSAFEEPIKTLIIENAMNVERDLTHKPETKND